MKRRNAIFLIAASAFSTWVFGQNDAKNEPKNTVSACPAPQNLINTDLFGAWALELQGNTTRFTMQRNPEFAESLAGNFLLGNVRHEVFGDIEDGALDLEESNNGKDIIAIWKGRVQGGSCGKAISGQRRLTGSGIEQNFVLRRSGW